MRQNAIRKTSTEGFGLAFGNGPQGKKIFLRLSKKKQYDGKDYFVFRLNSLGLAR